MGGLSEATEMIAAFAAMRLWPAWFPVMAYADAEMFGITIALRIGWGW